MTDFQTKNILITGGTGSFGKKFCQMLLERTQPKRLIIYSRDEFKQHEMTTGGFNQPCMRYFVGDVRDRERLYRALDGVDIVIHAAALKQVPSCEYNPIEAVKTNVMGAAHIIDAAIDRGVDKVIALSTDKAANPINLYGATKLCSDKLFIAANSYSGRFRTKFSVVRYGNVVGSRGSVIPLFIKLREKGVIPITHSEMTRFWITLEQGVEFVLQNLECMNGGEVFVPKIPSMRILDLAEAIAPGCKTEIVGIRPGEKIHEVLVPEEDTRTTVEYSDHFVVLPAFKSGIRDEYACQNGGKPCAEGFKYSSDTNDKWLSVEDLRNILNIDQAPSSTGNI